MKKKLFAITTALLILLSGCGRNSESAYSLRDAIMKNQENGNVELIREYIENDCNPDDFEYPKIAEVIKESNPFLYAVTQTGTYTGLPYLLILEGADVNGRSTHGGSTLLMNMAYNSKYEMCDYLFDKGASIESESFYPDIEVCKWLVEHGKSVDANSYSTTSTPVCDVYQSAECIDYLIECGADVNAKGVSTPLENAVKYGYYDSVVTLLENGAEIGDSIFTAVYGSEKILRYLCENGADLTLVADEGKTLLERAETASGAHPKASEILKEYGAKE